jgi:lipoprotein-releasing system permease protein
MNLITELFLAWRYFKPKRNAVSVITLISVIGVALGVCVLMVVLSVMTGFTSEIKSKIIDTRPHIEIYNYSSKYIANPGPIIKKVDSFGANAVARTQGEVLVQKGEDVTPQYLVGIDAAQEPDTNFISKAIIRGKYSLGPGQAVVSYVLANQLGLHPGSKLIVHSPAKLRAMVKIGKNGRIEADKADKIYLPTEFTVSGIYSMGEYTFDSKVIIANIDDADDLFGYPWGAATMIGIKTKDPFHIDGIYSKLTKAFPEYKIVTWKQMNKQFLDVLAVEKNMMFFVLVFIVLVAASSITNTLITVVVQKTKEIGLLRSLGASPGSVMKIFILQGFFVGLIGTIVGLLLGYCVIYWRMDILNLMSNILNIQLFPKQFYYLSELPAKIVTGDVLFIAICSIVLCTLGGVIPAFRAARLDPAKALRYE